MAFQSREEYEAWKRRAAGQAPASGGSDGPAPPRPSTATTATAAAASAGDMELRLSPLYGALVVFVGLVFTVIGLVPFGKAGPTFHTLCLIAGPVLVVIGIVMLRRRKVIVRMTSEALHLRKTVIPWNDIQSFERVRERRNYWIGINLKTRRTDLDEVAKKARAALRAMGSPGADFDYVILETDLPRSGIWFIEECQRCMAAAGGKG
jgi:hypothetical protein